LSDDGILRSRGRDGMNAQKKNVDTRDEMAVLALASS
jgi:hypothetical protein